jgi:putative tricarboxylic transport membrane protein
MTKQGRAGKAVGAAVLCSAIGGTASALLMMAATEPLAKWAIRNIGPPEIFALVFFGLAVASSVGGNTIWKGWMSVLLGLLVATVGQDPVGGINRYNFGMTDLAAGIAFVPAILGFFAVSEIFIQAEKRAFGKYNAPKLDVNFPTFLELWRYKIAVVRSILVGFFCGILPGIGATLAAFMGYGEAVRWSKDKESFGKGNLEGVISSETANNAATGAAMIPLLALGLPGGALTAIMVAVFQFHDMEPGPLVFYNSPELIWVVFAAMFYANVSILFIGLIETKTILQLLRIPFHFLAPMILMLASIGSYIGRGLVLDVMVMFLAGMIGFLLRRSGYSIPGIVLGIILGKIGEQNFAQGMQMVHYDLITYLSRPICLILIVAGAITLGTGVYKALASNRTSANQE